MFASAQIWSWRGKSPPSPSLDKSRSFKEEVCLVGKADMYRGGLFSIFEISSIIFGILEEGNALHLVKHLQ